MAAAAAWLKWHAESEKKRPSSMAAIVAKARDRNVASRCCQRAWQLVRWRVSRGIAKLRASRLGSKNINGEMKAISSSAAARENMAAYQQWQYRRQWRKL
jgi:hypothetical protein